MKIWRYIFKPGWLKRLTNCCLVLAFSLLFVCSLVGCIIGQVAALTFTAISQNLPLPVDTVLLVSFFSILITGGLYVVRGFKTTSSQTD